MNIPTDIDAELARRTANIESGAWTRREDGKYTGQGWDASEVVGKDGLATKQNGEMALWLNGEPAWHKLGTVADGWTSVQDALTGGGLLWQVEKRPNFWGAMPESVMGVDRVTVGQPWSTVRVNEDGSEVQLGTVGDVYVPFQNEEAFSFLQDITEQDGSTFVSAGLLSKGSMVFVAMDLGQDLILDPDGAADAVKRYLMFTNRHDGKGKVRVHNTPTRPVCANTVDWAVQGARSSWEATHTPGARGRVGEARRSLNLANQYYAAFEQDATSLIQTPMSIQAFDEFIAEVVHPLADDANDRTKNAVVKEREEVRALYLNSKTNEKITGTRWGAAQAVIEQIDHLGTKTVPKSLRIETSVPKTLREDMARGARVVRGMDAERKSEVRKALLLWRR